MHISVRRQLVRCDPPRIARMTLTKPKSQLESAARNRQQSYRERTDIKYCSPASVAGNVKRRSSTFGPGDSPYKWGLFVRVGRRIPIGRTAGQHVKIPEIRGIGPARGKKRFIFTD
jgi:hypothetical protein